MLECRKDTCEGLVRQVTGELKGDVSIVADDAFGACANFDGDIRAILEVPSAQSLKITGDVTIEAWAYITKEAKDWARVIGKGTWESRTYGLWYQITGTGTTWLFQRGSHDCKAVSPTTLNTWYHLAGVVEGKKSVLYVHDLKGKLIATGDLDKTPSGAAIDNDSPVTIGYGMMHSAHSGKIAHARIYKGALTQTEIERDITKDRLALVPFRKSHPIDFRLYDEDGQPALYIVDGSADAKITTVKLELTNSATQSIEIPPAPSVTSADHHHFGLRFRPGTLSDSTKKKLKELTAANQATILKETDEWELAHDGKDPAPVNLFLSYKGQIKVFRPAGAADPESPRDQRRCRKRFPRYSGRNHPAPIDVRRRRHTHYRQPDAVFTYHQPSRPKKYPSPCLVC